MFRVSILIFRRYIDDMYPPPPPHLPIDMGEQVYDFNGPYDPYMRKFPPYINYPSNRYLSDYRDYPPLYDNGIDNRYYMRSDMMPQPMPVSPTMPRKRMIYYAYLPEIVRSPPTVDLRYRTYDRYDPIHYNEFQNYETNSVMRNAYRHSKPMRQPPIAERGSVLHDNRTVRPMGFYNDDVARNSTTKEKRMNLDRFYSDNRPVMPQSYRRFREYDPYFY